MGPLLGLHVVGPWLRLLVERDIHPASSYWVSSNANTFRYARGQPMGALSSWPVMALAHHLLVQFSAYLVGWRHRFDDYLVLGDDVIIANKAVAEVYVRVLEDLGVKIRLNESFISEKGFGNFTGRSFLGKYDLSPISLSEEVAVRGPSARVGMALRSMHRGLWSLSDAGWLNTCYAFLSPNLLGSRSETGGIRERSTRYLKQRLWPPLGVRRGLKASLEPRAFPYVVLCRIKPDIEDLWYAIKRVL